MTGDHPLEVTTRAGGYERSVLLIDGWAHSQQAWSDEVPDLKDTGFRLVAYDRRGSGWPQRRWVQHRRQRQHLVVGEAMQCVDYNDHDQTPKTTAGTTTVAARNALQLVGLLRRDCYQPQY